MAALRAATIATRIQPTPAGSDAADRRRRVQRQQRPGQRKRQREHGVAEADEGGENL